MSHPHGLTNCSSCKVCCICKVPYNKLNYVHAVTKALWNPELVVNKCSYDKFCDECLKTNMKGKLTVSSIFSSQQEIDIVNSLK